MLYDKIVLSRRKLYICLVNICKYRMDFVGYKVNCFLTVVSCHVRVLSAI